jgi:DNA polymerase-3 subunit gamma/tau
MGLVQAVPDYRDPERSDWSSIQDLAGRLSREDVQLCYEIAVHARRDLGLAPDPRTGLEMALLRMLAFRPEQAAVAGSAGGGIVAKPTKAPVVAKPAPGKAVAAAPREPEPVAEAVSGDDDWQDLLERLELSGPVRELARNITLESRDGNNWQFLIPDAVSHLGSSAIIERLRSELSSQIGQPVDLALHTAKEEVVTAAALSEQAEVRRMSEAERAIANDPTVKSLKERFAARVVDDSIQPLQ